MKSLVLLFLILVSYESFAAYCPPADCPRPKPAPTPCSNHPRQHVINIVDIIKFNQDSWKASLDDFSSKNLKHPSWGYAHANRNYHMTILLAQKENVELDLDVLYAASYLHDLGGLKGFEETGVDHALKSAQLADEILPRIGFPVAKIDDVKEIILGHTYYTKAPANKVAQLFRDADVLDFLGNIGVARILSIPKEDGVTDGTLKASIDLIKNFSESMPTKCISLSCKKIAQGRRLEMHQFIEVLNSQTLNGKVL